MERYTGFAQDLLAIPGVRDALQQIVASGEDSAAFLRGQLKLRLPGEISYLILLPFYA